MDDVTHLCPKEEGLHEDMSERAFLVQSVVGLYLTDHIWKPEWLSDLMMGPVSSLWGWFFRTFLRPRSGRFYRAIKDTLHDPALEGFHIRAYWWTGVMTELRYTFEENGKTYQVRSFPELYPPIWGSRPLFLRPITYRDYGFLAEKSIQRLIRTRPL